eukprot:5358563-Prymnesium_polylepis.1
MKVLSFDVGDNVRSASSRASGETLQAMGPGVQADSSQRGGVALFGNAVRGPLSRAAGGGGASSSGATGGGYGGSTVQAAQAARAAAQR